MNNFSRHGFLRCAAAAATAALLAGGLGVAQAGGMEPYSDPAHVNAYMGIGYGFQIRTGCDGADTCEAGRDATKIFGGYRFTPSLATEVSYYYLGHMDKTWATGNSNSPSATYINSSNQEVLAGRATFEKSKTSAIGIGLALESEMFPNAFNGRFIQHLRVGLAVTREVKEQTWDLVTAAATAGVPSTTKKTKNRVLPYVGAGLSFGLSPRWRVFTSADTLIGPDRNYYVFSVGGGGEF
jgi:OmpA-like transmembrane domain